MHTFRCTCFLLFALKQQYILYKMVLFWSKCVRFPHRTVLLFLNIFFSLFESFLFFIYSFPFIFSAVKMQKQKVHYQIKLNLFSFTPIISSRCYYCLCFCVDRHIYVRTFRWNKTALSLRKSSLYFFGAALHLFVVKLFF